MMRGYNLDKATEINEAKYKRTSRNRFQKAIFILKRGNSLSSAGKWQEQCVFLSTAFLKIKVLINPRNRNLVLMM